jgi:hypothetical protein
MKRSVPVVVLAAYAVLLIKVKVMVFKDVPVIRIGHLMFKFGGADANGQANFVPVHETRWRLIHEIRTSLHNLPFCNRLRPCSR